MKPRPDHSIDQRSSQHGTPANNQPDGPSNSHFDNSDNNRAYHQGSHQSDHQFLKRNLPGDTHATPYNDLSVTTSPYRLNRRDLFLLAGASFAVISLPRWLQQASAQTTTSVTTAPNLKTQQQSDFLALSALLTAKLKPNSAVSARLYAVLSAQFVEFEKHSADLWQFVQIKKINDVDALVGAVADNADLSKVLHQIVSAWYLGVVGSGVQAKVIAFDQALMFDPVRDAVVVPTYCRAAPGYWVKKPAQLVAMKARV
ncbi:sorbitol dehydrogenase family protein [Glaciimonas sp. CA11.2]|uniref:sorbitol dehydrogenase family protein n=1 Tax=Glaciimonas sp. CA11.2 TaxID=3048601 RepID=UPI002AB57451|nr:sorbitol dehydrogenase family protein [Glaciimonas sp. CA11.2]MDY7546040.1 sorbitol dehydrogenase family protein [Glaciimonas sp. CA11.2]MEB0162068.1 sorbitol dehydrogenase family protein [Glaciimonas sp. CA11.2]